MGEPDDSTAIPRPPEAIRDALAEQHAREAAADAIRKAQIPTEPRGQPDATQTRANGEGRVIIIPSLWVRARQLAATLAGGRVQPKEFQQRLTVCWRCSELELLTKGYKEWMFCRRCGCWRIGWLADLRRKLRYKNHICPLGRHKTGCVGCGG